MSTSLAEDDPEKLAYAQRLKAAVHYTVGKICEEMSSDLDVVYDRKFIAVLTEATFKYCQTMATDLELFAKHAKRMTVNSDDVKLLVRKSPELLEHIEKLSQQQEITRQNRKKKSVSSRSKMDSTVDTYEDSNSNL
ncbi:Centromere protein S [Lamellibrachia satsuma]|nr:Centromere protein S [Lamellibrachia satsuma]